MKIWTKISRVLLWVTLIAVIAVTGSSATSAGPQTVYSAAKSVAALGDSITQAANSCVKWDNCPADSWSTGSNPEIQSHAKKLSQFSTATQTPKTFNNSQSFTKTGDLVRQAQLAVSQKAEYITILSGANDVCAPTVEEITSDKDFYRNVQQTLETLTTGLPLSKIFIASIPNIQHLYTLAETTDPRIIKIWEQADICQSMFQTGENQVERQKQVTQKIETFNSIIQDVCNQYENCIHDNNAVFNHEFTIDELSPTDHFHPSPLGQKTLSEITWKTIPSGFLQIERGIPGKNNAGETPVVKLLSPKNDEITSGEYKIQVYVQAENPVREVYLETVIGTFTLIRSEINPGVWEITVDTSLAPNGIKTTFRAVAVDKKKNVGVSSNVTAMVDNSIPECEDVELAPTPEPTPTTVPCEEKSETQDTEAFNVDTLKEAVQNSGE